LRYLYCFLIALVFSACAYQPVLTEKQQQTDSFSYLPANVTNKSSYQVVVDSSLLPADLELILVDNVASEDSLGITGIKHRRRYSSGYIPPASFYSLKGQRRLIVIRMDELLKYQSILNVIIGHELGHYYIDKGDFEQLWLLQIVKDFFQQHPAQFFDQQTEEALANKIGLYYAKFPPIIKLKNY